MRERAGHALVEFVAADVSNKESVAELIADACEHLDGPIDVLVNSAGGDFAPALFHDSTLDDIEAIVSHWLLSTMYCCRLALPHINDGGAIVNVASDAAKVPTPGEAVVGAAMAGIAMFSRTLAMEAKRRRIRVNVVTPSLVRDTRTFARVTAGGFSAKLFEKATRAAHLGLPEPDEVAAIIAFLGEPGRGAHDRPGHQRERRNLCWLAYRPSRWRRRIKETNGDDRQRFDGRPIGCSLAPRAQPRRRCIDRLGSCGFSVRRGLGRLDN